MSNGHRWRVLQARFSVAALAGSSGLAGAQGKGATAWPDTPTMIEAGFPQVVVTGCSGCLAPAAAPPEIIQKFYRESARHDPAAERSKP